MKFDDLTQVQRIELMRVNVKGYLSLCTMDHLVGVLDAVAKLGPYVKEEE